MNVRRLPALGLISAVILAGCTALLMMAPGAARADSAFGLTFTARYCNALDAAFTEPSIAGNPSCAEDLTPGSQADVTVATSLPLGHVLAEKTVMFIPATAGVTPGTGIATGTVAGGARVTSTFGVLNGACTSSSTFDTVLYNVALPANIGNPRASANLAYPRNEGQADRFGAWAVGAPPANGAPANIPDANADMIADAGAIPVQNYPEFLLDAFDPDFVPGSGDGPANPLVPTAAYGGLAMVQGEWRLYYVLQFAAGQLAAMPGPYAKMTAEMGQPAAIVTNDPTQLTPAPAMATDECSPHATTTMLLASLPGGYVRASNPSAGTQYTGLYSASLRDLDQDGIANGLDTCPKTVNTGSDADADGIDNACDTNLPAASGTDVDGDGFQNREDNCPQDANASQTETERSVTTSGNDLGPRHDEIGDACETGSTTFTQNGASNTINLSSSIANGRYLLRAYLVQKCFGSTDADGDGYCTPQDGMESGACAGAVPPSCAVRHNAWSGAHPGLQMDTDNDMFSDVLETYFGTDGTKSCAQSATTNNELPLDNSPFDANDSATQNTIDIGAMLPLNQAVNAHPRGTRFDFNSDGVINTIDVGRHVPVLSKTCAHAGIPPYMQQ